MKLIQIYEKITHLSLNIEYSLKRTYYKIIIDDYFDKNIVLEKLNEDFIINTIIDEVSFIDDIETLEHEKMKINTRISYIEKGYTDLSIYLIPFSTLVMYLLVNNIDILDKFTTLKVFLVFVLMLFLLGVYKHYNSKWYGTEFSFYKLYLMAIDKRIEELEQSK